QALPFRFPAAFWLSLGGRQGRLNWPQAWTGNDARGRRAAMAHAGPSPAWARLGGWRSAERKRGVGNRKRKSQYAQASLFRFPTALWVCRGGRQARLNWPQAWTGNDARGRRAAMAHAGPSAARVGLGGGRTAGGKRG